MARRFLTPHVYRVRVCEQCERQADAGAVGGPCPFEECDGTVRELEVVPLEQARRWRTERNAADEKVERLHAELVDTFEVSGGSEG